MNIQVIIAVAELCRATGYAGDAYINQTQGSSLVMQRSCQRIYLTCLNNKGSHDKKLPSDTVLATRLSECVFEAKLFKDDD